MLLNFVSDDPQLKRTKVDDEIYRTYHYADGYKLTIISPVEAHIKAPPQGVIGGGSHRVIDAAGTHHMIPAGWRHMTFKVGSCVPDKYIVLGEWDREEFE